MTVLLNAFVGSGAVAGAKGVVDATSVYNVPLNTDPLNTLMNPTAPSGGANASINYILFDEQMHYLSSGVSMVAQGTEGSTGLYKQHTLSVAVEKSGYLYVYCSNESNYPVFFDNLSVQHTPGPILEETHYYPFGLTMQGISSGAAGGVANKKKYNGIDHQDDLGLNEYDAFFRDLDPQTGRWWQVDPKTEGYENLSPYASMYNDPLRYSDPLGDEGGNCCLDGVLTWVFSLSGKLTTPTQKENAQAAVSSLSKTVKRMGENAKINWESGNTPLHEMLANPMAYITGAAELNTAKGLLPLESTVASAAGSELKSAKVLAAEEKLANAAKGNQGEGVFLVSENGTTASSSQTRMKKSFEDANLPSQPTSSPGTQYTLPDGRKVRTMEASGQAPKRASFDSPNGHPVDINGKTVNPPKGLSPTLRRQFIIQRTHIIQI